MIFNKIMKGISDFYGIKSFSFGGISFESFGRGKSAGVNVTPLAAIQHASVYACVRDKAESIGQLPIKLYRRGKNGIDEEIKSGRMWRIFTQKPNSFMTMQDLAESYVTNAELYGNYYMLDVKNDLNSTMEILPFRYQTNVGVNMDQNGNVYYTYITNDGRSDVSLAGGDVAHVKLNSLDGMKGLSAISCNARSIGLAIAQDDHLSDVMESGAMPTGVLETTEKFGPKDSHAIERIRQEFDQNYTAKGKNKKTIFLEQGLKYNALTMTPADSELILQRKYSREEICGIFRVPPHRIGATGEKNSGDVEQSNKDYYVNKLMPLVKKFEAALNQMLSDGFYVKVDERGFISGDIASLTKTATDLFKMGHISIDESRVMVGLQPLGPEKGGSYHAMDTNNITLGLLTDVERLQAEHRTRENLATLESQNNGNNQGQEVNQDD